jgi:DNA polymerase epsilon subunit 1
LNRRKNNESEAFARIFANDTDRKYKDYLDEVTDLREFDVPFHTRVCVDLDIRISYWYNVKAIEGFIVGIDRIPNMLDRPNIHIMAFDIETSKLPLKFPDAKIDSIMMISIVIDGDAFLITNRAVNDSN